MADFDALPCWHVPVGHTVASDVGSLSEGEHPVFFATHVELPIRQQKGGHGIRESADVLDAFQSELNSSPNQNTVVAVTGPSGSGKSHLVRWVQAKLTLNDGDLLVYVPRHVTTLRETLELVCGQIGGEVASQLLRQLEAAVGSVSEVQLSGQLIDALCQVLEHEPSTAGVSNVDLILPEGENSRRGLPSIMRLERVRDHLLAEDLTTRALAESILGVNEGGDQERPQFEDYDLEFLDLVGLDGALDNRSKHTRKLLASRDDLRSSALELINRAVDPAVQRTLGWRDGPSLRSVFTDVRKRLAGKQLVLLFEDLALVNFVEGAILDEFANHGSADRAPLRVMFAVTDDKYTAMAETIEGRVTSHYRVEALLREDAGEDAGDIALREEFIARQLNLARVGRDKIIEESEAGRPLPVGCSVCGSREECFDGFGSVSVDVGGQSEQVGLFPYNRSALRRAFRALRDDRDRDNRRVTARAAIDRIVIRALDTAHNEIVGGTMPGADLQAIVNDQSYHLTRDDVLTGASQFDEATQERIYWTRVLWMDEEVETHEVARAFGLPEGEVGGTPVVPKGPWPESPSESTPNPTASDSPPSFIQDVLRWVNNENDEEPLEAKSDENIRVILERLVTARIDLRSELIAVAESEAKRVLGSLLGRNSFSLGGAGRKQEGRLRFELPRGTSTYRLVVGAAWIDTNKHWDFRDMRVKWRLPRMSEDWKLPIEVEAYLSSCVERIREALLAAVGEECDSASVAFHLRSRAASASVPDPPPAWLSVASAADEVRSDQDLESIVRSFAGAVGPSGKAEVAALDIARLVESGDTHVDMERLKVTFPSLVKRKEKLDKAQSAAMPILLKQSEDAVRILAEAIGDSTLKETAHAIISAGQAANEANFFRPELKYPRFIEACNSLTECREPSREVADRLRETSFDAASLGEATCLLKVASNLSLLKECCEATQQAGDERVAAEAGGLSAKEEEARLASAGEELAATLRELAEELSR